MREAFIRFGIFAALFLIFSILEGLKPRRDRVYPRGLRWPHNLGVLAIGSLVSRPIPVLIPFSAALLAEQRSFGLFNTVPFPGWAAFLLTILVLDLVIYWQHRLFHTVPLLSRVHRMHHTDRDIDTTTALRFHPLEIFLSMIIKTGAVWILGAPAAAVLVFEIILNGTAMFNHANLFIPRKA
ncbi:MAG: sterol desaturase family protein, partial [Sediminispirochaetaceae bacterium]